MEKDSHRNIELLHDAIDERTARIKHDFGQAMMSGAAAGMGFGTIVIGALVAKSGDVAGGLAVASGGAGAGLLFAAEARDELKSFSEQLDQRTTLQQELIQAN